MYLFDLCARPSAVENLRFGGGNPSAPRFWHSVVEYSFFAIYRHMIIFDEKFQTENYWGLHPLPVPTDLVCVWGCTLLKNFDKLLLSANVKIFIFVSRPSVYLTTVTTGGSIVLVIKHTCSLTSPAWTESLDIYNFVNILTN